MAKSLLFLPDISGYTKFVQTTEIDHSQHVISELLEVLVAANTEGLQLAEIEGDALFFYKEGETLSQERLLAQIESMFTAFYSHLELLKKNRICPCMACATAPNLELKIIAHAGHLQHIEVQETRKPFGEEVIKAHRLLKNSVNSDNYILISSALATEIQLSRYYSSRLFRFRTGKDVYDNKEVEYLYSLIEKEQLQLQPISAVKEVSFQRPPDISNSKEFPLSANKLLEYITNYVYRKEWVEGVDAFLFPKNEVTRLGSQHVCVINHKHINFTTVTKKVEENQLVYGEHSTSIPAFVEVHQFYILTPLSEKSSRLDIEVFWKNTSFLKKIMVFLFVKRIFKKNLNTALNGLFDFVLRTER